MAKNVTLTRKFLLKNLRSSNPTILSAFPKTPLTKMKSRICPGKERKAKEGKAKRRGEERKRNVKVETAVSLLYSMTLT